MRMTNEEKKAAFNNAMKDGKRFKYLVKNGVGYDLAEAICWKNIEFPAKEFWIYSLDEIELAFKLIAEL